MPDYAVNLILKGFDEATPVIRKVIAESRKLRSVRGGPGMSAGGGFGPAFGMAKGSQSGRSYGGRTPGGMLDPRRGGPVDRMMRMHDGSDLADRLNSFGTNMDRIGRGARSMIESPLQLSMELDKRLQMLNAMSGGAHGTSGKRRRSRTPRARWRSRWAASARPRSSTVSSRSSRPAFR